MKTEAANSISKPKVVVFDLYGTMVKFGIMHHPFRTLLKWAREQRRLVRSDDARTLMTFNADLFGLSKHLGISAPEDMLVQLQSNIDEELASLTLFDDVLPTLEKLESLGFPVAVCSNLAQPYGAVINRLLPGRELHLFLSYEVGFIKPEPLMYHQIVTELRVKSAECLFVGDSLLADYEGPTKNGMQARHLVRGHPSVNHSVSRLDDIFELLA